MENGVGSLVHVFLFGTSPKELSKNRLMQCINLGAYDSLCYMSLRKPIDFLELPPFVPRFLIREGKGEINNLEDFWMKQIPPHPTFNL